LSGRGLVGDADVAEVTVSVGEGGCELRLRDRDHGEVTERVTEAAPCAVGAQERDDPVDGGLHER
jgi:hypothetical protein